MFEIIFYLFFFLSLLPHVIYLFLLSSFDLFIFIYSFFL